MKVIKLSSLHTGRLYPPVDIPVTHFCQKLSRPQSHSAAGRITSKKKCISFFVFHTVGLKMTLKGRNSFPHFSYCKSDTIVVSSPIACACGNCLREVRHLTVRGLTVRDLTVSNLTVRGLTVRDLTVSNLTVRGLTA